MSEFTIRIEAPELAKAITNLAIALCATVENSEPEKKKESAPVSTQAPEEAKEPQRTIEEVRAVFSEYAKAKGKDKAKELLLKYGASKVTELKAEDYNAAIRDIRGN